MNEENEVDVALERAEVALAEGRGLRGTGFWKSVNAVKRDPALVERYADRIGAIDRRAFEAGVRLRVPLVVGLTVLIIGTAKGVAAVIAAVRAGELPGSVAALSPGRGIDLYHVRGFVPVAFLLGLGLLVFCTHTVAHWIVGRLCGIRFSHVFLGGPARLEPGVKTDYATYLRASLRARIVMLASGAVMTKIVPFALLPASLQLYGRWPWLTWMLLMIGAGMIVTDVTLSTKTSDWMRVKRELRAARA